MTRLILPVCTILFLASSLGQAQDVLTGQPFVALDHGLGIEISDSVAADDSASQTPDTNGPVGQLHGCVYNSGGSQFQAVKFKMKRAATVRFDALLYRGASCSADQFIDEFGFGNKLSLGAGTWIFWFVHFPGQLNTSGRWRVGKQRSQCVDYQMVPDC